MIVGGLLSDFGLPVLYSLSLGGGMLVVLSENDFISRSMCERR